MRIFLTVQLFILAISGLLGLIAAHDGFITGPPDQRVVNYGSDAFWTVAPVMFVGVNALLALIWTAVWILDRADR